MLIEELIREGASAAPGQSRTRHGPVWRLQQQRNAVRQLSRAKQRFVVEMLDTVLAQQSA